MVGQTVKIKQVGGSTFIRTPDPSPDALDTSYLGEIVNVGVDIIEVRLEDGKTEYLSIAHILTAVFMKIDP